jgi:hypothetical protein
MVDSSDSHAIKSQLWPIFICYRQVDGLAAARRLHELLDKRQVTGPTGEVIEFDVYLDQTMPAVADWREIHRPYLERARALIVICTPGARIVDGPEDWVHKEISWWLDHRHTVPILIDPFRQGIRYVPTSIRERWPEIQRIPLVEAEWTSLSAADLAQKANALRRQIVGNIRAGGILLRGSATLGSAVGDGKAAPDRDHPGSERGSSRRAGPQSVAEAKSGVRK